MFLLSPAHLGGERARILLRDEAEFDLATRVRAGQGAPVGEIFAFLSGLYFRGKLAYASAFARGAAAGCGAGLRHHLEPRAYARSTRSSTGAACQALGTVDIDARVDAYRQPLLRDARALGKKLGDDAEVVLLGSIASTKYTDVLGEIFGDRLVSPIDFVGRGDMSRGSIMLKAARAGVELAVRGGAVSSAATAKVRACRAR